MYEANCTVCAMYVAVAAVYYRGGGCMRGGCISSLLGPDCLCMAVYTIAIAMYLHIVQFVLCLLLSCITITITKDQSPAYRRVWLIAHSLTRLCRLVLWKKRNNRYKNAAFLLQRRKIYNNF